MEEAKKLGYDKGRLRILAPTHVLSFSRGLSLGVLLKDGIKRGIKTVKEKTHSLSERAKSQALADKKTKKVLNLLKQAADGAKRIGSA